ncbi:5-bromo-4-chloroindolyl phosphate hydrolysis family protein [Tissierella sp. MSJ-40]|uniref:5-bromo-4-chloroindolyl phosphate hydrolysis family protein n=1 Tax=Tissierella simiarum TaxID=2841534 RepID=A0ABS6E9C8_9FIRM|nr:5-bromo-4-chloroindolyl phosphate hydrolysis family protein [Tissierella simiarum]MBU5439516.1 5-bromo-4-chloroindolyl phosphate hydrolysis family protein [Tissierella simiarum]
MNKRSKLNLGDEIKNIVQDALNNADFKRLNRDIENVVKGALDEVRRSIDWKRENHHNWNNQTCNSQADKTNDYQHRDEKDSQILREQKQQSDNYNTMNNYNNAYRRGKAALKPTKFAVPVGQVSGTLFTVFGIIGSTVFGIGVIVLTLLGYLIGSRGVFHTIAMGLLPCFIASIILCMNGSRIRKRLKRFQRYISQMRGRSYCLIKDFSSATGLSNKSTVKDLRKMIAIGMFPEGRIDDKKTCFMLNNECYEQYLKLQEDMKMKDLEEQEKQKNQTTSQDFTQEEKNNKNDSLKPEIRKAIDEGRQFVMEIKNANIAIPGEEISRKLDRLEEVTGKIFDYVEIHPEKFPEIKKFTEYFLPTTLKLVDAYRKLDYQPVQGENISSAKKEIEETMDTINLAFENLLDGLFEDVAMDISTDISVLETMFAQEGLTEKNMRVKNKTMEDKK